MIEVEFDVENVSLRSGLQYCGLQTGLVYGVETFASIADPRLQTFGLSVLTLLGSLLRRNLVRLTLKLPSFLTRVLSAVHNTLRRTDCLCRRRLRRIFQSLSYHLLASITTPSVLARPPPLLLTCPLRE
jgi:hypothetical protein